MKLRLQPDMAKRKCENQGSKEEKRSRGPASRTMLEAKEQALAQQSLAKEFQTLYTSNKLSAQDSFNLFQKGSQAGLALPGPFAKSLQLERAKRKVAGQPSQQEVKPAERPTQSKNAARTWQRWMRKNHTWPDLYWAEIPLKNPSNKEVASYKLPFLLPHEWVSDYLHQPGAFQEAQPEEGSYLDKECRRVCAAWHRQARSMVPLGLHGDGVPVQGRLQQSTVDFVTINLLASKAFASTRVPVTCLETKWNAGAVTIRAIQQVIAWSLKQLGEGKYPSSRHDGGSLDKARAKLAGQDMPSHAALVQMRGDWDWNCKWFGAPNFSENSGMCWLCKAKPEEWRAMSSKDRESKSLSQAEWLQALESRGKPVSPLFALPGITNASMKPDWMHVVDEGSAALAAGQILAELLQKCRGGNKDQRAQSLWASVQSLWQACDIPACRRLKKLTVKDIVKPGKAPDLDAKAAEVRYFCHDILEPLASSKKLQEGSLHDKAVYNVAKHCTNMYKHFEAARNGQMVASGEKFLSQYLALEGEAIHLDPEDTKTWRAKPKLHLLGHLLDEARKGHNPKDSWNYRDETVGFQFQKLFYKRGGQPSPGHQAEKVLLKWAHEEPFPSLKKALQSSSSSSKA